MSRNVELARQQWADSYRSLVGEPPGIDARVREQMEVVTDKWGIRISRIETLDCHAFLTTELARADAVTR